MSLTAGQVVNNRYRVARLLGQGGMGAVYRAWDLSLNIPVALKEMIPEPGIDSRALAQLRAQFRREAQVLAGLAHPSLPRVTDFFEWGGNVYLVMDFVEGESLDQLIARQGALPEGQVVGWAIQLLDALAACHARHVVHRDVKPQNIIIRTDGRAVLVDFGLVKLWDPRNPQTQRIIRGMGTREYASPEHFGLAGHHTEPRSDIYSLGATLYHALTGREPPAALERWADVVPFVPPRRLGVKVRPQVEAVLLRAMALDPAQRFSTALDMQAALRSAVGAGPVRVPSVAPPVQAVSAPDRQGPIPAPIARDVRWRLEMATGMVMALVGVLVVQVALFADTMTVGLYLGRSVGALLLGVVGWFIGDLAFQALARPERSAPARDASRPTQRLVAFTRRMTRRLTTSQQAALLAALLVGTVVLVWLLGPVVSSIPYVWNYIPFYALVGPLAYAVAGRKPWRALVAHVLVITVGGVLLGARVGFGQTAGALFLASAGGGLLMEGIAFLAEKVLLNK